MAKQKNKKAAKDTGKNKQKDKFDSSVLLDNPSTKPKKLPRRVYKRGKQGTFAYSPDIAIYVYTADHGIIDLGPHMTSFNIQRNVNAISTFSCSIDNKFSRFDRVIRRMDRVAVFLKRVEWVQVFAGYITLAPWETIVPGDTMIEAECTLKRLQHTFWDPYATASWHIFPFFNAEGSWSITKADGGAGQGIYDLLTDVVHWDSDQIKIQKLPEKWLQQAAKLVQKVQADEYNDQDTGPELQTVKDTLAKMMSDTGWFRGSPSSDVESNKASIDPTTPSDSEAAWRKSPRALGKLNRGTEVVSIGGGEESSDKAPASLRGNTVYLRRDASVALEKIMDIGGGGSLSGNIGFGYLSITQINNMTNGEKAKSDRGKSKKESSSTSKYLTQSHEEGWGTIVYLTGAGTSWASKNEDTMNKYGWFSSDNTGNRWEFTGNSSEDGSEPGSLGYQVPGWGVTTSTSSKSVKNQGSKKKNKNTKPGDIKTADTPDGSTDSSNTSLTNAYLLSWPGPDPLSNMLVGSRAWINDVPVMETIQAFAGAANRDFMSGPNGDFIAFFPDRVGLGGKEPVILIRDIEVTDLNLEIHDDTLVTHYVSVGDIMPLEPSLGVDVNQFWAGMVTIEMDELMRFLLGFDKEANVPALGEWMLGRFGIRPKREDNSNIRDAGWNFCMAIHRFQEYWASQWATSVGFTFLPEIFPGMRVELADHQLALYVEGLNHTGSRAGGWSTQVIASTPMRRVGNQWKMLRAEWPVGLLDAPETQDTAQFLGPYTGYRGSNPIEQSVYIPPDQLDDMAVNPQIPAD